MGFAGGEMICRLESLPLSKGGLEGMSGLNPEFAVETFRKK